MTDETANGFRGKYAFLSNFALSSIPFKIPRIGVTFVFPTVEHAFQALKIESSNLDADSAMIWACKFASAPLPNNAKYLGRSININRQHWDSHSYNWMKQLVETKFSLEPYRQQLIDTEDIKLVEYNTWNDTLWGVNQTTRAGKNQLGTLLMEFRSHLQQSQPEVTLNPLW